MQTIELETRKCLYEKCSNTFRVMPQDLQVTCGTFCFDKVHNTSQIVKSKRTMAPKDRRLECRKLATETIEVEYGMTALGDQKKESQKEKRPERSTISPKRALQKEPSTKKIDTTVIKNIETDTTSIEERSTLKTHPKPIIEKKFGEKITKNTLTKNREKSMPETEKKTPVVVMPEGESGILPSDSTQLSKMLRTESESSVMLLDSSARQLVGYADQLAKPPRVCEETKEVIQKAPSHQIMDAVKCLDAARNMMKTKLDYMAFGQRLAEKIDSGSNARNR